ncbi:hypothetical protein WMY93_025597 [Mugilogobius chulae]|uniref:Uncharacterized protein n=1 Tax=Mugilogobius chulae TaxID=88201 RepID=A0AAW0MV43_9GOBI
MEPPKKHKFRTDTRGKWGTRDITDAHKNTFDNTEEDNTPVSSRPSAPPPRRVYHSPTAHLAFRPCTQTTESPPPVHRAPRSHADDQQDNIETYEDDDETSESRPPAHRAPEYYPDDQPDTMEAYDDDEVDEVNEAPAPSRPSGRSSNHRPRLQPTKQVHACQNKPDDDTDSTVAVASSQPPSEQGNRGRRAEAVQKLKNKHQNKAQSEPRGDARTSPERPEAVGGRLLVNHQILHSSED